MRRRRVPLASQAMIGASPSTRSVAIAVPARYGGRSSRRPAAASARDLDPAAARAPRRAECARRHAASVEQRARLGATVRTPREDDAGGALQRADDLRAERVAVGQGDHRSRRAGRGPSTTSSIGPRLRLPGLAADRRRGGRRARGRRRRRRRGRRAGPALAAPATATSIGWTAGRAAGSRRPRASPRRSAPRCGRARGGRAPRRARRRTSAPRRARSGRRGGRRRSGCRAPTCAGRRAAMVPASRATVGAGRRPGAASSAWVSDLLAAQRRRRSRRAGGRRGRSRSPGAPGPAAPSATSPRAAAAAARAGRRSASPNRLTCAEARSSCAAAE